MSDFFDDLPTDRNDMTGWDELYQEVLLEHYRQPRQSGRLPAPAHEAQGFNRLCGDRTSVFVQTDEGTPRRLQKLQHVTQGCAICTASASLMAEALQGHSLEEAQALKQIALAHWVQGDLSTPWPDWAYKLESLDGVHEFPARVKCASLPWHTLDNAMAMIVASASTPNLEMT